MSQRNSIPDPHSDPNLLPIARIGVTYNTEKKYYTVLAHIEDDPGYVAVFPSDTASALELAGFIRNGPNAGLPRAIDCLLQIGAMKDVIPVQGLIDSYVGSKIGARLYFADLIRSVPIPFPMEASEVVNICHRAGVAMFIDRHIYNITRQKIEQVESTAPNIRDVKPGGNFDTFIEEDFNLKELFNAVQSTPKKTSDVTDISGEVSSPAPDQSKKDGSKEVNESQEIDKQEPNTNKE